jgi:hypothetical protein
VTFFCTFFLQEYCSRLPMKVQDWQFVFYRTVFAPKNLSWVVIAVMKSKRKVLFLTSLVALLTFTSALLLALAPPPLAAGGYDSLAASDRGDFLDAVFKTAVPAQQDRWKYIYVHHSGTSQGDANSLAQNPNGLCDHFVIGNGKGAEDGEIQIGPRWNQQQAPAAPPGVDKIDPDCISICLVGNFDTAMPTPAQLHRLTQLVSTLQNQLHIGADRVILLNSSVGPSTVGRYFPVTAFRDQILP